MKDQQLDPLRFVKYFASVKHAGQFYSGLPYTHHLAAVEQVLRRYGPVIGGPVWEDDESAMLQAAWLHDVVEDTGTKIKEITEMFGPKVSKLVWAVTDEDGEDRTSRKAKTYPKTRKAGRLAVRLKLADRIANMEQGGSMSSRYVEEYDDFRRNLFTAGENEDMWEHLDNIMRARGA